VDTSNLVSNLTNELVELSQNKAMRDAYRKEAIATITEKYNAENMTREIEKVYKKLLKLN
jgi:glycosyltransferase involved in cell wall biosynthesis